MSLLSIKENTNKEANKKVQVVMRTIKKIHVFRIETACENNCCREHGQYIPKITLRRT